MPPLRPSSVAVVGGGIAGLACARELLRQGCEVVVFEAEDRLGGRCSSRSTRVGLFDDGAQCIADATRLARDAVPAPGELAALHPWTVAATPAEEERAHNARRKGQDDIEITPTLLSMGHVGVPSMVALAEALARPLQCRLDTRIVQAVRQGDRWRLSSASGEIERDFEALVLAMPAPVALPLARESAELSAALAAVRYRSRWVLLLGSERPVPLPGYRELQGSPIERMAAMHSKPGRPVGGPQRWFIEADERWSWQHAHEGADTIAELLLENFRVHAGRSVTPHFLQAIEWRHAFVERPASTPARATCLWDARVRLGVCGDSVVPSRVDRVHRSGVDMARVVVEAWNSACAGGAVDEDLGQAMEAQP